MKLGRMNHVGYAVPSMEEAIAHYQDVMGATSITEPFDIEEQGVKAIDVGGRAGKERLVDAVFAELDVERDFPLPGRAHTDEALEAA